MNIEHADAKEILKNAMSAALVAAADAWSAMLGDGAHMRFMETHYDTIVAMAVALSQANAEAALDWDAVRASYPTEEEEQTLLALVFAVQEVIEVVVRENLGFLIDGVDSVVRTSDDTASALQRDAAAQQEALVQKLPERFRLAFIQTLREHWAALHAAAAEKTIKLNRLLHMSWCLARPYVLLRIVTSDTKTRILKLSMQQFHQLRYSTAKVLQEMNQVEAHPIMRLTNLERHKTQLQTADRLSRADPSSQRP